MKTDNDLSALVPDPPPPRPAAREAALAEALRRFDGQGPAPTSRPSVAPRPVRPSWARPQVAAFASAVLVVLVSVPIWWAERDRIRPAASEPAPAAKQAPRDAEPAPAAPAQTASATPAAATPAGPASAPAPAAVESNLNKLPQFVPAQTPPARDTFADAPAAGERSLAQLPAPPPPPAPVAAAPGPAGASPALRAQRARQEVAEAAAEDESDSIVVTGSRVARGGYEARAPIATVADVAPLDGAWNACTLRDPRRNPTVCRSSARLSEGLSLAWQGDLDRAIEAFGRAIAAEPDSSLAYLNRGLAYQQRGNLDRALADLNRAVARDRTGARAYYHRSLLHRARGDEALAEADAKRAVELDPDYAAVLP